MDIFIPIRFRTSVQLAPVDLIADFQQAIIDKVRSSLEGVCSRYGYIRPGSINIVKRSAGSFVKQHFNGHIKFEMICRAEVCNPTIGSVFQAIVKNKNALGVHAESHSITNNGKEETVLDIIIPKRSVGIVSLVDLEELQNGDKIFVEVLGKRYQLNDKKISIIARAIREPKTVEQLRAEEEVVVDDDAVRYVEGVVDADLQTAIEDDEDEAVKGDDDNDDEEDDNDSPIVARDEDEDDADAVVVADEEFDGSDGGSQYNDDDAYDDDDGIDDQSEGGVSLDEFKE
jgi:hypothetical protein